MPAEHPVVVATYSRRMVLRLPDGREADARMRGKRLRPVCGDRVVAAPIPGEPDWLITSIVERENALTRPNLRGQPEILAANVDQVIATAAVLPDPDWYMIDRYLCAAENMGAEGTVVLNKTDLAAGDGDRYSAILAEYEALGYAVFRLSAGTGLGLAPLVAYIDGRTAIVVGQSGVGKSTLINALTGSADRATGEISARAGSGRHTTVNSVMMPLPAGGAVIDSPGVRDFSPALSSAVEVGRGFREIETRREHCRFANCRHLHEPGCAVRAAVDDGDIGERRYESYCRLLELTERLNLRR